MSLIVTALAIALQSPSPPSGAAIARAPQAVRNDRPVVMEHYEPGEMVEATPTEIAMMVKDTFATTDKDHDGYIEVEEAPVSGTGEIEEPMFVKDARVVVKPAGTRRVSVEQARAKYIAMADRDKDGRLDFAEFRLLMTPILAEQGIPAKWRADIEAGYRP